MEDSNKISYFFLGLGIGTAVGMLFAPKAGTETRDFLQTKMREGTDYLKREGQGLQESAMEPVERGRTLQNQLKNVVDAVNAGKQAYRKAVDEAVVN